MKNDLYHRRILLTRSLKSIPKENRAKFFKDFELLLKLAHEDFYENISIERN